MEFLPKQELEGMISKWHDADDGIHTYYLMPNRSIPNGIPASIAINDAVRTSSTGAVLLSGNPISHLIIPPFPIQSMQDYPGWNVHPLHEHIHRSRKLLVVLIRHGGFSIGIFQNMNLLISKTSSPFVKARHRKGGSSSGRFARKREEQTQILLNKACEALTNQFKAHGEDLDHLILGGDKQTLIALEKKCTTIQKLKSTQINRIINVREPRFTVLKSSLQEIYTSRMLTFKTKN
jgi:hypothetical protein